jgi:antitoxin (DNA-binding transcriptional repressor) of toxin-antitoxin stability system
VAHSFELPPHGGAPAEAVDAAVDGQVVHLNRDGQPVAAVVPADVATAGAAAVEALEEAEDIRAARAALADHAPRVPLSEVLAEYADDLAAARFGHVCCARLPHWRMIPGHLMLLGWLEPTNYGASGSGTTAWST